jgi:predicted O-methyltransferase YrrM
MTGTLGEPTSPEAVNDWMVQRLQEHDRFAHVARLSESHRAEHGCDLYSTTSGNLLGVLAGAIGARRILEVGCGLGYADVPGPEDLAQFARLVRQGGLLLSSNTSMSPIIQTSPKAPLIETKPWRTAIG